MKSGFKKNDGAKTWYIADGWLPLKNSVPDANLEGHEAIMILNYQDINAEIFVDVFFEDREPLEEIKLSVPAKRIKCFRIDKPEYLNGVSIERLTQYALRLRSSIEVIVQYGRMDVTQPNLAYIGMMAFPGT